MWSIACMAKFQVMNSTIGLRPAKAAPTPTPAKPYSVIGVSTTRVGPNSSSRPWRHLVGALIFADLLAHDEDRRIAAHLLGHGVAQRLAHGHGDHLGAGRDLGFGPRLGRRYLRPRRRLLDVGQALAEIAAAAHCAASPFETGAGAPSSG